MNKKTPNTKDKVVRFLNDIYVLNESSSAQLILKEEDILNEIEESDVKVKASIQSLKRAGVLKEAVVGYVPDGTVPASNAVFCSQKNRDCSAVGYKITIDQRKFEKFVGALASQKTGVLEYDSQTGVISFGATIHKFQRGKPQHKLFNVLWDERKILKNGKDEIKGRVLPMAACAVRMDLIESSTGYKGVDGEFINYIKGINRILANKGFPLRIVRENGLQLTVSL